MITFPLVLCHLPSKLLHHSQEISFKMSHNMVSYFLIAIRYSVEMTCGHSLLCVLCLVLSGNLLWMKWLLVSGSTSTSCWGRSFSTSLRGRSMRKSWPTTLTQLYLSSTGHLTYWGSSVRRLVFLMLHQPSSLYSPCLLVCRIKTKSKVFVEWRCPLYRSL